MYSYMLHEMIHKNIYKIQYMIFSKKNFYEQFLFETIQNASSFFFIKILQKNTKNKQRICFISFGRF